MKAIQFIALLLLLLVTGVFWGTWFSLTRSLPGFSAAEFIHIGKTIIANVALPMRIIFPACVLLVIVSLFIYRKRSASFYWTLLSAVLIIITLLITLLVEVPIDNQINTWTVDTIPGDWQSIRQRWDMFHTARTFTSLGAFACYAIGVLTGNKINNT